MPLLMGDSQRKNSNRRWVEPLGPPSLLQKKVKGWIPTATTPSDVGQCMRAPVTRSFEMFL